MILRMLIFFGSLSAAQANLMVQMEVFECADPFGARVKSSAMIFYNSGKTYAVGSEARSFSDSNIKYCNEVVASDGSIAAAQLTASDYGRGLALWHIPDLPSSLSLMNLPAYGSSEMKAGKAVQIYSGTKVGKANLLRSKSDRTTLPQVAWVYEIFKTTISSTDIGSSVWNDQAEWIGMVSHEYVSRTASGFTQLNEWPLQSQYFSGHVTVIPAQTIRSWIESTLDSTVQEPKYYQVLGSDRWNGISKVRAGSLWFQLNCSNGSSNDQPTEITQPIGGDGFGIGGSFVTGKVCKAIVTNAANTSFSVPTQSVQPWFTQSAQWLRDSSDDQIEIWYLHTRDAIVRDLKAQTFGSLSELFRSMTSSLTPLNPTTLVRARGTNEYGLNLKFNPERNLARVIKSKILSCFGKIKNGAITPSTDQTLRRAYFLATVVESESFADLLATDFKSFLESAPQKTVWQQLFNECPTGLGLYDQLSLLMKELP
jgi:hypothetical protein